MDRNRRVSEAAWDWRRGRDRTAEAPRIVRVSTEFLLMSIAAAFLTWGPHHSPVAGGGVFVAALFVLVSGLGVHSLYRAWKRLWSCLARAVARVMTWLLLVPFYCIFFTLGRIGQVLRGNDPLCLKHGREKGTFWVDCGRKPGCEQDRRQF